jgi:hypothetical protein
VPNGWLRLMQSFRTVVMCVVAMLAPVCSRAAGPGVSSSDSREVALLRHELEAREREIAQLKAELLDQPTAAIAYSFGPAITNQNRGLTPSSSLSLGKGEQIARLFQLMKPGSSFCTVMPTGSMKPFFDEKAVLLMEPAPFGELKVGDIVTYRHPQLGLPVVHRLVIKDGNRFWARGDNNGRMDDVYVTAQNYIRRVYAVIYTDGLSN